MWYLLYLARERARRRGAQFEIDVEWVLHRLVEQNYRCARTNLELQLVCPRTNTTYSAFSPSLDRIDSARGYTSDNVELVCYMYNSAKNRYSAEEVVIFAEALVRHQDIVNDDKEEG